MTTTKPLRIGRTTVEPGDASEYLAGTHIMVYDPSAPHETYVKGLFGMINADRGPLDERESRVNAVLFAYAKVMREQMRAMTLSLREELSNEGVIESLQGVTLTAALHMAEKTLKDLDNLIGE